ncbi:toxic anion resistance protein [Curtobacterium sp. MCBD17_040]|uniref:toxic anion resistance protein n=1 Tax=Curtobacterium sp. MCBD17_040 TaxID=2175674 RepID=UPI000DA77A69|nr:toxic anion resistance protein [Curtobacterium sp. MCBD17_040]WIB64934.1 toxic anion resistance protein [Curtobacterium sp. MCBD17_040]
MSELDLDAPLTPPEPTGQELQLTPPAAVPEVEPDQAVGMVAVPADKRSELQDKARAFADALAAEQPGSPEFTKRVDDLVRMGEQDIRSASQVSSRMLERPATSLAAAKGQGPAGDPQAAVARTLQDLRETVTDLDPARAELTGARRLLGRLPGANRIARYFHKYESAQQQLDAVITALVSGQDSLRRDNAAIEQERAELWATMGRLAEYATLAAALDDAISAKAEALRASDGRAADALVADALFPVRQRRQDLATQIAVSVQGYLALDLIRKNNLELIRGVDRARTTTVAALRTAIVVAQALGQQRLVLEQVAALNSATDAMIGRTSDLLRQQTAAVHEQATSSGVSVETLQHAFDQVFATMDAIDAYRAGAVQSMATTVDALGAQVERARGALARSHAEDASRTA